MDFYALCIILGVGTLSQHFNTGYRGSRAVPNATTFSGFPGHPRLVETAAETLAHEETLPTICMLPMVLDSLAFSRFLQRNWHEAYPPILSNHNYRNVAGAKRPTEAPIQTAETLTSFFNILTHSPSPNYIVTYHAHIPSSVPSQYHLQLQLTRHESRGVWARPCPLTVHPHPCLDSLGDFIMRARSNLRNLSQRPPSRFERNRLWLRTRVHHKLGVPQTTEQSGLGYPGGLMSGPAPVRVH